MLTFVAAGVVVGGSKGRFSVTIAVGAPALLEEPSWSLAIL
ncbi:MAG: hypothetical protein ACSHYB_13645 [Roseibacillus sp.]